MFNDDHPLPIVADLLREHGMDVAAEQILACCATCRHWGKRRLVAEIDLKRCRKILPRNSRSTPIVETQLTAGGGSLYTPAYFGCRLWEKISPRETATS